MVAINYSLILSALTLLATAAPLLPRDASPADSITYCSAVSDTSCSATSDPTSPAVVTLPADWYGHFECYATVDGVDRYFAGHPPIAPGSSESRACWATASSLDAVPGGSGARLCSKSQLANCCDMTNLSIEGLNCAARVNKVAGLAVDTTYTSS
ncbi:hypothetical protein E2P81_ATG09991 [Venturia nashicola]|uniref:Uncharacterized protein n=1 Tax=Venturia nashicola TaxID=86259 RepID=A0A4Z1NEQ7_9PEZI|nr:hypothetical protein E6O75_ATG10211 [Venturia nashicola]TLD14810.1 hypothetical protein E2P81_ATG09991 [Venturia nashicola]